MSITFLIIQRESRGSTTCERCIADQTGDHDSEKQADEFDWSFIEDKAASKQSTVNVRSLQQSIHNWIECHSLQLTNRLKTESSREIVSSSYESLKGKSEHVKFNLSRKVETN